MNEQLAKALATVRRRMIALGVTGGAGWALAACVAALLGWMWLDLVLDFPGPLRAAAAWGSLLLGAVLLVWLATAAARSARADAVARRLDDVGHTRGQILAGLDLAVARSANPLTAGLAAMAISRAAALSAVVPAALAAPAARLRRPLAGATVVLIVAAVIALTAPRLARTQWARFTDPFGDHPPYSRVEFDVEPGDVKVIYGQGFDIRANARGGLVERAEVVIEGQDPLPMFGETAGGWRATVANVTSPATYFVRAAGSRTRKYRIDVVTVPKLEGVRVRVTPPAYTNLPPYDDQARDGGVSGLAGTRVEFTAQSNRPLAGGEIEFTGGQKIVMTGDGNKAVGSLVIAQAGKITLRVRDTDGQYSTESFSAPIALLKDDRPFVRLLQPMPNSFATPTTALPIELVAEDDFGVARVQLFRSLNDSRPMPTDLPVPAPAPTRLGVSRQLPLASYGLKPGDVIKVFARVEDTDPAGAKGSESNIAVVRIVSDADYKKMVVAREGMDVLQSKYAQAERRLEAMAEELKQLKDELAKKDPNAPLDAETQKKIEELAEKMAHEAAEIEKSAKEDLPFDIDKKLNKELEKLAKKMAEAAKETADAAKKPGQTPGGAAGQLDEVAKKLGAGQKEFEEEAMAPLEHLAKIFPLIEDQARFVQLYEHQKELTERLSSLKDKQSAGDDPKVKARMRDIEEEQRKLRDELGTLLDDIEKHVAELPDDEKLNDLRESATEFVRNVRDSDAAEWMRGAEQALADFDGKGAHHNAKVAEETLAKFIGKCKSMGDKAGQCLAFQPKLAAGGLGDTVEQLLGAEGLGTGPQGKGSGGGYSASRNTLKNVGIYGQMARMSKASKSGGGRSEKGVATDGRGNPDAPGSASAVDARGRVKAGGEAQAAVPVQYKRRVGDYFRRVADEIGEK